MSALAHFFSPSSAKFRFLYFFVFVWGPCGTELSSCAKHSACINHSTAPSSACTSCQQPPASASNRQQPPAAASSSQQLPAAASNRQQPPAANSSNRQQPPAATASSRQQPPAATARSRQQAPAATSSHQQQLPAASTAPRNVTKTSTNVTKKTKTRKKRPIVLSTFLLYKNNCLYITILRSPKHTSAYIYTYLFI